MKNYLLVTMLLVMMSCSKKVPPMEYFPDMADSPAIEAFEEDYSAVNNSGNRLPPEGTIPRGYTPYPYSSFSNADTIPNKGLTNPVKPSLENYQTGEKKYQIFCTPCHGPRGEGNGTVRGPAPRYDGPVVPLVGNPRIEGFSDGQIYHVITVGKGLMSNYATQIDPDDRWKLILYLRKLQEAKKATVQK